MTRPSLFLALSFLLPASLQAEIQFPESHPAGHMLWYEQPAANWNEALPVGNGRMGAMVFGNPEKERIQLNEDSMWAGELKDVKLAIGTPADLAEMRKLIDEGKLVEADQEIVKRFSRGGVRRSHQTLGDMYIDWHPAEKPVTDYRRDLNLRYGLATTTWKRGATTFTQQVFCSNPEEALFVKLSAKGPDTVGCSIRLDRPLDNGTVTHKVSASSHDKVNSLHMTGQVTQVAARLQGQPVEGMKGVRFAARLDACSDGGRIHVSDNTLEVKDARVVYLKLTAQTDFGGRKIKLDMMKSEAVAERFNQSCVRHIKDHLKLYRRCELKLPSSPERAKLPTDKRLVQLRKGGHDPDLEALIFHYGRYLLIACSRANGNPANLQGMWNEHIQAPWNNDYHLNINLQMNYWPAELTHLSETHKPVFAWMQQLAKNGAVTAEKQYGMRGWVAHHASELFAQTVMKSARTKWGGWIHGGGWMCQHVWDHYDFTRDKKFLKEVGYPLLSGQARFYLDWLVEKDGKLISSPESSPENGFLDENKNYVSACAKGAMGQQIITEVFTNTLAAAKVLAIEDAVTREIEAALPKLDRGQHIGPDGRLLEWDKPRPEAEIGHRHLSHLYGFHPGTSITEEKTPDLFAATRKSLETREKNGSVGIGWSRAWAINIHARLRDGDTAVHHLREMLRTQTMNNGFNSIFGVNNKRQTFQIEANLGATAGVAEMLLQSHGGFLHILPALPESWPEGSIKGLRARGGHTIDITWKNGELVLASITRGAGVLPAIRVQDAMVQKDERIRIRLPRR